MDWDSPKDQQLKKYKELVKANDKQHTLEMDTIKREYASLARLASSGVYIPNEEYISIVDVKSKLDKVEKQLEKANLMVSMLVGQFRGFHGSSIDRGIKYLESLEETDTRSKLFKRIAGRGNDRLRAIAEKAIDLDHIVHEETFRFTDEDFEGLTSSKDIAEVANSILERRSRK